MKIAVPLFKERISPHFGSSSKVLLIEVQGNTVYQEAVWDIDGEGPMDMARRLMELKVEEIVCGGIQDYLKQWLMGKGVVVVDNQEGAARSVVHQLLEHLKDVPTEADI